MGVVTARVGVVGVHGRRRQPGDRVDQGVLGGHRELVGLYDGQVRADHDVGLGAQGVPDPPHAQLPEVQHPLHPAQRVLGGVDEGGVDGVHQPSADLAGGVPQDQHDGEGDQQSDGRVGGPPAQRGAARAEEDREGGEPVGTGVQPVGDQRGGADPAAGADPVAGHPLVPGEPGQRRRRDRPQVGDLTGVQEPVDGSPGREGGGRGDGEDDEHARQVLGPAVTVGVAAVRRPAAEDEGDAQGYGGQGVGGVVHRVAEQGHRPGQGHDHGLDDGGHREDGEGGPQGAHPLAGGLHRGVDLVRGLVAVRPQQMAGPVALAAAAVVVVVVVRVGAPVALHGLTVAQRTDCGYNRRTPCDQVRFPRNCVPGAGVTA